MRFLGVFASLVFAVLAPGAANRPGAPDGSSGLARLKALYARPASVVMRRDGAPSDPVFALGERLFFESRLSASGTLSCAGCHQPASGWSDHRPRAKGEGHQPLAFRAPTLIDVGLLDRYGWIGRFRDIEAVSLFALTSPQNMAMTEVEAARRLSADPASVAAFDAAFPGGGISKATIGTALARYVASIVSGAAPFDRWIEGDEIAIGADAKRGFALFTGKAHCARCHGGWSFTDGSFHDIGTARDGDTGRGALFKTSVTLQYAFKTPTLRGVAQRAPYTHAGAVATLADMIDLYDRGGIERPSRDQAIVPLHLSAREKADLVAFLGTLSGPTAHADITR